MANVAVMLAKWVSSAALEVYGHISTTVSLCAAQYFISEEWMCISRHKSHKLLTPTAYAFTF